MLKQLNFAFLHLFSPVCCDCERVLSASLFNSTWNPFTLPSILTAFEDIIICFFPLGYNVMDCYSLCWNRLLRVSLFAFLDTVLLKHVTFHNNFGSQLLKVSKQQIKLLINCKHRLTIFNKGAYWTFKSIFHKALNLF